MKHRDYTSTTPANDNRDTRQRDLFERTWDLGREESVGAVARVRRDGTLEIVQPFGEFGGWRA